MSNKNMYIQKLHNYAVLKLLLFCKTLTTKFRRDSDDFLTKLQRHSGESPTVVWCLLTIGRSQDFHASISKRETLKHTLVILKVVKFLIIIFFECLY